MALRNAIGKLTRTVRRFNRTEATGHDIGRLNITLRTFNTTGAYKHDVEKLIMRRFNITGEFKHDGKLIRHTNLRRFNTIGENELDDKENGELEDRYKFWGPYLSDKVRNQGKDQCWAIGPAECLEAIYKLYTGETVVVSPQHILDRAPRAKDQSKLEKFEKGEGSGGGSVMDAFKFMETDGVALESDWPHAKGPINEEGRKIKIGGYRVVKGRTKIKKVLRLHPSVGCIAVHPIEQFYSGDIIESRHLKFFETVKWDDNEFPMCEAQNISCPYIQKHVVGFCHYCGYTRGFHTVVLSGYDTRTAGKHHWIFRNTRGEQWGVNGYGMMKMTESEEDIGDNEVDETVRKGLPLGLLNIEQFAVYPIPHYSWKKREGLEWKQY